MNRTKGIFWLASYPKSGNTWFRVFLANLINLSSKEKSPIYLNHVNDLINDHITTSRSWVNEACGYNTVDLTDEELDALLPTLFSQYHEKQSTITYHKNHRAYSYLSDNQPLIPLNNCLGAIYFIRNPLDVAISLANHFNLSIDDAIKMMGDKSFALRYFPLRQLLFSWSMHVDSWVESGASNLLVLRYEDMLLKPLETFTKATNFLQFKASVPLIEEAITCSSFDKLKQFENEIGFLDKPPQLKHFFRKGIAGDWKTTLNKNQIEKIITEHGEVMKKFGYLTKAYEPIIG